ncbi:MAG: hypothetical protein LBS83_03520 [Holosporales bacterium]|jgi:hypothetical protein|nr:hypothetical protein [Holosporales bacterium]
MSKRSLLLLIFLNIEGLFCNIDFQYLETFPAYLQLVNKRLLQNIKKVIGEEFLIDPFSPFFEMNDALTFFQRVITKFCIDFQIENLSFDKTSSNSSGTDDESSFDSSGIINEKMFDSFKKIIDLLENYINSDYEEDCNLLKSFLTVENIQEAKESLLSEIELFKTKLQGIEIDESISGNFNSRKEEINIITDCIKDEKCWDRILKSLDRINTSLNLNDSPTSMHSSVKNFVSALEGGIKGVHGECEKIQEELRNLIHLTHGLIHGMLITESVMLKNLC